MCRWSLVDSPPAEGGTTKAAQGAGHVGPASAATNCDVTQFKVKLFLFMIPLFLSVPVSRLYSTDFPFFLPGAGARITIAAPFLRPLGSKNVLDARNVKVIMTRESSI